MSKAMNESSGAAGGFAVPEVGTEKPGKTTEGGNKPNEDKPEHENRLEETKAIEEIGKVAAKHHPDGEDGHVYHYKHSDYAVHHSYPTGTPKEKVDAIKNDLESIGSGEQIGETKELSKVPGLTVHQEEGKPHPPDESWKHVFGIKEVSEVGTEQPGEKPPAAKPKPPDEDEANRPEIEKMRQELAVAFVKQLRPFALAQFVKDAKKKQSPDAQKAFPLVVERIKKFYPELKSDQLEAVAFGMGKAYSAGGPDGKTEGGMNPREDTADETPRKDDDIDSEEVHPHGVKHGLDTINFHRKAMPAMHPNDKTFYSHVTGMVNEHSKEEYPGHAHLFDTGSEKPPTAPKEPKEGATGEGEDDNEADAKRTEEALARYRSFTPLAVARIVKRMKKAHKTIFQKATEHMGNLAKLTPDDSYTSTHQEMSKVCHKEMCKCMKELDGDASDDGDSDMVETSLLTGINTKAFAEAIGEVTGELLRAERYKTLGRREDRPVFTATPNGN